jgi:hypothetical protein
MWIDIIYLISLGPPAPPPLSETKTSHRKNNVLK